MLSDDGGLNEVLAQQLAQPLINGHRHLLALELTVPSICRGVSVRILCTMSENAVDRTFVLS